MTTGSNELRERLLRHASELRGDNAQELIDTLREAAAALARQEEGREAVDREAVLREYVEDYEFLGETEGGRDACYQPNERERLLIEDAIRGWEALELPATHPAPPSAGEGDAALVDRAVTRFLSWRLPDDFAPDSGISFKPITNTEWTHDCWPTGTNLLHAGQAKAMFEHCLATPAPPITALAPHSGGEGDDFWRAERACAAWFGGSEWASMAPEAKKDARAAIRRLATPTPQAGEGDAEPMRSCHEYNPPRAICVECMAGRPERCVWIAEARKHGRPIAGRYATSAPASPQGVSEAVVERACAAFATSMAFEDNWPSDYTDEQQADLRKGIRAALTAAGAAPEGYQDRVGRWMDQCFVRSLYSDMTERGDRLLEEVLELLQAHGYDRSRVATLVDYVFGRPAGEPAQEVGGVMVTLAGYCYIAGLNMHAEGNRELARITQPAVMEKIRAKQEAKNALHFDTPLPGYAQQPGAQHGQEVMRDDAAFHGRIGRLSFTPAGEGGERG